MHQDEGARALQKDLSLATATSLVVGCVIGAGVFFKPYAIYQATGGAPGMGLLAWVVGGLLSLFGALTFAEVAILIPRAIVGGVAIIMAVYLAINVAYLWVIPAHELAQLESPAAAVAVRLFGPVGGTLIKVGIIISVIGAGNGFLMSGSRVAYELAKERTLPASRTLGAVRPLSPFAPWALVRCTKSLCGFMRRQAYMRARPGVDYRH